MNRKKKQQQHHHHPEDVNVSEFVSIKLSGTNYFVWKSMMLTLIESQGLKHIITKKPKRTADDRIDKYWKRMDGIVRKWIIGTVRQNILINIVGLETARVMWGRLALKFSKSSSFAYQQQPYTTAAADHSTGSSNASGQYLSLAQAVLDNNWEKAEPLLKQYPELIKANITGSSETILVIAVRSSSRIGFARKLMDMMSADDVALVDNTGSTALHVAAGAGNIEAAKLLVGKNPKLSYIYNHSQFLPLHDAADAGKKEMVLYLMNALTAVNVWYHNDAISQLVALLISSGLYDVAHFLVQQFPKSATSKHNPLAMLTRMYSAFPSRASFNFWQRVIYSRVPINIDADKTDHSRIGDIDSASSGFTSMRHVLYQLFWKVAERLVPQVKNIRDKKLIHYHAQQLSKKLMGEIVKRDCAESYEILEVPLIEAAALGVHEIVEEILCMYPGVTHSKDAQGRSVFQVAIVNRREKVFNIIYQFGEYGQNILMMSNRSLDTALHIAGRLEKDQKIKLRASAAGAALQMQRELQWFKEVEKITGALISIQVNADMKMASEIFSETHEELVKEGEIWMKDTSNSCAIVAALIVTVVFAAAITIPGGYNTNTGLAFFAKRNAFIVFAISDILALFSSTLSLLMFLSILTSRYAEADFLYALPKRLIIGLTTLFLSIIFMMVAFSAAVKILFGDLSSWVLFPVVVLACIPVTLFMSLQFSLLVDIIKSTYGSGIFGKQSDRIIF